MRWLKRQGVKTRRILRRLTDEQVVGARRRYILGDSLAALAQSAGVAPETQRKDLRRAGVDRI